MEADIAMDMLEEIRVIINANLESLIEEQKAIFGEVAEVSGNILLAGGKRLRPIVTYLVYQMAGGDDIDAILPLAMAFELIHTATLVHDDINDNSNVRRGKPTMHSMVGQSKAIIGGDWLFVQGFGLGGIYNEDVVKVMADCCAKIASAEFMQIDHVLNLATSPEDYLEIVKGKTAGPFAAAAKGAAMVADLDSTESDKLFEFGMELGIAFQLVDDLLDVVGDERIGKPRGIDVYEGKMTLPLIHALTILHGDEREELESIITNFDDSKFERLIQLLEIGGSINYSEILVNNHLERASQYLEEFDDCDAKSLLQFVASMVKNRNS